ncbi:hypothetical protein LEP1GSC090_3787 [Leptospira borgpetersenii serovar Javanica str. MK146]|nr:hypothetical protein LEP1GSC090_3787 [Leptospira borgpetersenii serovar Javanica str. MK146]
MIFTRLIILITETLTVKEALLIRDKERQHRIESVRREKWKSGKVEKWKSGKVEKWKSGKDGAIQSHNKNRIFWILKLINP